MNSIQIYTLEIIMINEIKIVGSFRSFFFGNKISEKVINVKAVLFSDSTVLSDTSVIEVTTHLT